MVKSVIAYTYEIDDPELAVGELLSQIKEKVEPRPGMLGIVFCSYDFIDSGVIAALSEALPFDIIGETTVSQAVRGEAGVLFLTLMVLYSHDCSFAAAVTDALGEEGDAMPYVEAAYAGAKAALGGREKLILAFPPLQLLRRSGDSYVNALSAVSANVPVFGATALDDTVTYEYAFTIINGKAYRDRLVFALAAGEIEPEFLLIAVSGNATTRHEAEVTDSVGNILRGVNDMPLVDYLETIGLASGGKIREGINTLPFLMRDRDENGREIRYARVMFAVLPDGSGVCGGEVPVGTTFTMCTCDVDDVVRTTRDLVDEISEKYPGRVAIIFSCMGRRFALAGDPLLEFRTALDHMRGDVDFIMAYSAGEICPVAFGENGAVNRFHNYTLTACIL